MNKKAVKEQTLAQQALAEQAVKDEKTTKQLQGTPAGELWNEIKDKTIEMYGLPDQKVFQHVHPVDIEPSKLYLLQNSSAVLPSLEGALGKKYVCELADRFIVVTHAVVPLTAKR